MRVLDVKGWTYGAGPTVLEGEAGACYESTMIDIARAYNDLIKMGAKIEDARGILPTNIHTNIVAKFDLRTMADTARKRASSRTQGEYRSVMEAMKAEVIRVHPWASLFFGRTFDKSASELEDQICNLSRGGKIDEKLKTDMIKLLDAMRTTA